MDKVHFVSTIPYNEEMVETNLSRLATNIHR